MITNSRRLTLAAALTAIAALLATQVWWPGPGHADAGTTPSGITVLVTGETTATVSWDAVANAKDYRFRFARANESYKGWKNLDWNKYPTDPSVELTGLTAGTECKFKVRSRFNGSPSSPWSAEHRFTTQASQPAWQEPEAQEPSTKKPATDEPATDDRITPRDHGTSSNPTITYHGDEPTERASNLTVVRRDHKDVHFTWVNPTASTGNLVLYRRWNGANSGGVLCLHRDLSSSHTTSYTDTTVASYHPGGDEATYEYRLYTNNGDFTVGSDCDRAAWPTSTTAEYVKFVVQVDHHEDVYAATNTGTVQHNDPQVPTITSVTAGGRSAGNLRGAYVKVVWNAIPYAPGYRIQYKKTSEADTEWKETYGFRAYEREDDNGLWDNCTGNPAYSDDSSGALAAERGAGTRLGSPYSSICHRANYPTDQVGLRWPVYWGADGHDRIRYAPTRFTLQRLDANTQYDIRVAMCTELEDSSTRGLQVCAAVDDYSSKRTIRTVQ